MPNMYSAFKKLIPDAPLLVGTVSTSDGDVKTITLQGGGVLKARGTASNGQKVFVRDGVIEGLAPNLTLVTIDI